MSTKNQLTGGAFQDILGNLLVDGYLLMELSQDASTSDGIQITAGTVVKIPLDASGNVVTSPAYSIWPNDVLTPANTFYNVSAFTSEGQLVWGPNPQQVFSTPSPFNIGVWIPGSVATATGNVITYDVSMFLPGSYLALQTLLYLAVERPIRFAASMVPSTAVGRVESTGTVVWSIQKNGTQFATVTFNSTSHNGVYSSAGASFAVNDVLSVVTSGSVDATLADVGLVLSATTIG